MAETKYESKVASIPCDAASVYRVLSDMSQLEKVRHLIPQDKVQELDIQPDAVRIKVDGLGQKFTIRIVDREQDKMIKFGTEDLPVSGNFWIQLVQVNETDTRIRLTLRADIPFMFKMMLDKKIQQGLDDGAQMLTQFPYKQWLNT